MSNRNKCIYFSSLCLHNYIVIPYYILHHENTTVCTVGDVSLFFWFSLNIFAEQRIVADELIRSSCRSLAPLLSLSVHCGYFVQFVLSCTVPVFWFLLLFGLPCRLCSGLFSLDFLDHVLHSPLQSLCGQIFSSWLHPRHLTCVWFVDLFNFICD